MYKIIWILDNNKLQKWFSSCKLFKLKLKAYISEAMILLAFSDEDQHPLNMSYILFFFQ